MSKNRLIKSRVTLCDSVRIAIKDIYPESTQESIATCKQKVRAHSLGRTLEKNRPPLRHSLPAAGARCEALAARAAHAGVAARPQNCPPDHFCLVTEAHHALATFRSLPPVSEAVLPRQILELRLYPLRERERLAIRAFVSPEAILQGLHTAQRLLQQRPSTRAPVTVERVASCPRASSRHI